MTMSKYDYGFALSEWDRSQSNPALNIQSGSVCSAPALLTQDELHVVQARSVHAVQPVDIVIAAIDLAPDLGRSRRQTRYQCSLENNTRHAHRRARVL